MATLFKRREDLQNTVDDWSSAHRPCRYPEERSDWVPIVAGKKGLLAFVRYAKECDKRNGGEEKDRARVWMDEKKKKVAD